MSNTPAPIPTRYAGCHFRSRLEARWAVFFDHLDIAWEYEPEGFSRQWNDETFTWLPDFHLPTTDTWIEVKGSDSLLRVDWHRILMMIDWGSPVPGVTESDYTSRGVLFLGPIPRVDTVTRSPIHPIAQHHKGVWINVWSFYHYHSGGIITHDRAPTDLRHWYQRWITEEDSRLGNYFDASWGEEHCFSLEDYTYTYPTDRWANHVRNAYRAALSARFEHGQSGAT